MIDYLRSQSPLHYAIPFLIGALIGAYVLGDLVGALLNAGNYLAGALVTYGGEYHIGRWWRRHRT